MGDYLPRGKCISWRANSERHDFRRIQPRHSKPTDGEEGIEYEKKDRLSDARLAVIQVSQAVVSAGKNGH